MGTGTRFSPSKRAPKPSMVLREEAEHTQTTLCGLQASLPTSTLTASPRRPAQLHHEPAELCSHRKGAQMQLFAFFSLLFSQEKACIASEVKIKLLCHLSTVVLSGKRLSSFESLFLSDSVSGCTRGCGGPQKVQIAAAQLSTGVCPSLRVPWAAQP